MDEKESDSMDDVVWVVKECDNNNNRSRKNDDDLNQVLLSSHHDESTKCLESIYERYAIYHPHPKRREEQQKEEEEKRRNNQKPSWLWSLFRGNSNDNGDGHPTLNDNNNTDDKKDESPHKEEEKKWNLDQSEFWRWVPPEAHYCARAHFVNRYGNNNKSQFVLAGKPCIVTQFGFFLELESMDTHHTSDAQQLQKFSNDHRSNFNNNLSNDLNQVRVCVLENQPTINNNNNAFTLLAVAWGLDPTIMLYMQTNNNSKNKKKEWQRVGSVFPSEPVMQSKSRLHTRIIDMVALYDDDDVTILAIARLGGYLELLHIPNNNNYTSVGRLVPSVAVSTFLHHVDITSLSLYTHHPHMKELQWDTKAYPHDPPVEFILAATGLASFHPEDSDDEEDHHNDHPLHLCNTNNKIMESRGECVSFWGVSNLLTGGGNTTNNGEDADDDEPMLSIHVVCLHPHVVSNVGPDFSSFLTPKAQYWWNINSHTTSNILTPTPIVLAQFNNSQLILLDGNGALTILDCTSLIQMATHQQPTSTINTNSDDVIQTLLSRKKCLQQMQLQKIKQIQYWPSHNVWIALLTSSSSSFHTMYTLSSNLSKLQIISTASKTITMTTQFNGTCCLVPSTSTQMMLLPKTSYHSINNIYNNENKNHDDVFFFLRKQPCNKVDDAWNWQLCQVQCIFSETILRDTLQSCSHLSSKQLQQKQPTIIPSNYYIQHPYICQYLWETQHDIIALKHLLSQSNKTIQNIVPTLTVQNELQLLKYHQDLNSNNNNNDGILLLHQLYFKAWKHSRSNSVWKSKWIWLGTCHLLFSGNKNNNQHQLYFNHVHKTIEWKKELAMKMAKCGDITPLTILLIRHFHELGTNDILCQILQHIPVTLPPKAYSHLLPCCCNNSNENFQSKMTWICISADIRQKQCTNNAKHWADHCRNMISPSKSIFLSDEESLSILKTDPMNDYSMSREKVLEWFIGRIESIQEKTGLLDHVIQLCNYGLISCTEQSRQKHVLMKIRANAFHMNKIGCCWIADSLSNSITQTRKRKTIALDCMDQMTMLKFQSMTMEQIVFTYLQTFNPSANNPGTVKEENIVSFYKTYLRPILFFSSISYDYRIWRNWQKNESKEENTTEILACHSQLQRAITSFYVNSICEIMNRSQLKLDRSAEQDLLSVLSLCVDIGRASKTTTHKKERMIADEKILMQFFLDIISNIVWVNHNILHRPIIVLMWEMYECLPLHVREIEEIDDEWSVKAQDIDTAFVYLTLLHLKTKWQISNGRKTQSCFQMNFTHFKRCILISDSFLSLGKKIFSLMCKGFCNKINSHNDTLTSREKISLILPFLNDCSDLNSCCFHSKLPMIDMVKRYLTFQLLNQHSFEVLKEVIRHKTEWFEIDALESIVLSSMTQFFSSEVNKQLVARVLIQCHDVLGPLLPSLQQSLSKFRGLVDSFNFIQNVLNCDVSNIPLEYSFINSFGSHHIVKSVIGQSPEAIFIECPNWSTEKFASEANFEIYKFFNAVNKGEETINESLLPPPPGGPILHLAGLLGLGNMQDQFNVKNEMVRCTTEAGFHGAAAAICKLLMRDVDNDKNHELLKNKIDDMDRLFENLWILISDESFTDIRMKTELIIDCLQFCKHHGTSMRSAKFFEKIVSSFSNFANLPSSALLIIQDSLNGVKPLVQNNGEEKSFSYAENFSSKVDSDFLVFKAAGLMVKQAKLIVNQPEINDARHLQTEFKSDASTVDSIDVAFQQLFEYDAVDVHKCLMSIRQNLMLTNHQSTQTNESALQLLAKHTINWCIKQATTLLSKNSENKLDAKTQEFGSTGIVLQWATALLLNIEKKNVSRSIVEGSLESLEQLVVTSMNRVTEEAYNCISADKKIVEQLCHRGYSVNGSNRSALMTNNESFAAALSWAISHFQDDNFDHPLIFLKNMPRSDREGIFVYQKLVAIVRSSLQSTLQILSQSGNVSNTKNCIRSRNDVLQVFTKKMKPMEKSIRLNSEEVENNLSSTPNGLSCNMHADEKAENESILKYVKIQKLSTNVRHDTAKFSPSLSSQIPQNFHVDELHSNVKFNPLTKHIKHRTQSSDKNDNENVRGNDLSRMDDDCHKQTYIPVAQTNSTMDNFKRNLSFTPLENTSHATVPSSQNSRDSLRQEGFKVRVQVQEKLKKLTPVERKRLAQEGRRLLAATKSLSNSKSSVTTSTETKPNSTLITPRKIDMTTVKVVPPPPPPLPIPSTTASKCSSRPSCETENYQKLNFDKDEIDGKEINRKFQPNPPPPPLLSSAPKEVQRVSSQNRQKLEGHSLAPEINLLSIPKLKPSKFPVDSNLSFKHTVSSQESTSIFKPNKLLNEDTANNSWDFDEADSLSLKNEVSTPSFHNTTTSHLTHKVDMDVIRNRELSSSKYRSSNEDIEPALGTKAVPISAIENLNVDSNDDGNEWGFEDDSSFSIDDTIELEKKVSHIQAAISFEKKSTVASSTSHVPKIEETALLSTTRPISPIVVPLSLSLPDSSKEASCSDGDMLPEKAYELKGTAKEGMNVENADFNTQIRLSLQAKDIDLDNGWDFDEF